MSRTAVAGVYLPPVKSDNTAAVRVGAPGFYTLADASTYYVNLGDVRTPYLDVHIQWTAPVVAVITFWSSSMGELEAPLTYSTSDGSWIQQDPSTAYVPIVGGSVSNLTITTSAVGGADVNLSAFAAGRLRARIVVTTGGAVRVSHFGKE